MKLPSLLYLLQHAKQSFLRFSFTIITALIAVCIGIYLVEFHEDIVNVFPYINVMLCAALGIPLFFCVDVFAYNKRYDKNKKLLVDVLAFILLVVIYFTLPNADSTQNTSLPYIRYGIYAITIHLLVAFVPFIGRGQLNGFWHYNRILFIRFITSLLYSGFLFAGLAIALGSLDFLFDIDLHDELFFDLFIFIGGLFNTWFFVSGIPATFDTLDDIREYPKGIKIFSQFVLLPLLILYLIILYLYASKIVVLWSWPKGIVSYLIACVAVLGILTLLLIHPYGNLPGNTWIRKFSKAYYFILIPLVILLFIAIGMRVGDYGITINRYVILLLGVWLTLVCIYFATGRTNIKFIPVSLAIILLSVSFGYWGLFSVSERSQVARLKSILEENKILFDEKIQREVIWISDSLPSLFPVQKENVNEKILIDSVHNEVKSILDYLDDHHGFSAIREWFHQDMDSIVSLMNMSTQGKKKSRWSRIKEAEAYMRTMGLEYQYKYISPSLYTFTYSSEAQTMNVTPVHDYDYLVKFSTNSYDKDLTSFVIDEIPYTLYTPKMLNDNFLLATKSDTITFDINTLIKNLIAHYGREYQSEIPTTEMLLHGNNSIIDTKIELHTISFYPKKDSLEINTLSGNIFVRKKSLNLKFR
jgi:hypothetical protein